MQIAENGIYMNLVLEKGKAAAFTHFPAVRGGQRLRRRTCMSAHWQRCRPADLTSATITEINTQAAAHPCL